LVVEKTMTVQLCGCGFLLSTALIVSAAERITIAVSPLQSMAPTNLRVRVHVTPEADNRGLELSADSGEYYRSSWIQLDGKEAPQTITKEFQDLPGGDYEIRASLFDSAGRARAVAHQQVSVLSSAGGD
jgi:hypothetical protein